MGFEFQARRLGAVYNTEMQHVQVGRRFYKLTYSLRENYTVYKAKMQNVKGGR